MLAVQDFPWRPKKSASWAHQLSEVKSRINQGASADIGPALRVLANQRLDALDRMRLYKVIKSVPVPTDLTNLRVALLSNKTLSFLHTELITQAPARGLMIECLESDFDTISALAMGALKWPEERKTDFALVVLDEDAFSVGSRLLDRALEDDSVSASVDWLKTVLDGIRTHVSPRVLIATIPTRPDGLYGSGDRSITGASARLIDRINTAIFTMAENEQVDVVDLAHFAATVGLSQYWDPVHHHSAKGIARPDILPALADRICSVIAALRGKSCRVLALDLDNTLWHGVIADDGLTGIEIGNGSAIGEAYLAIQRWASELRKRGIILTIVSKNNEQFAKEPFVHHPDMALKLEDFALFDASWTDKATVLENQAQTLRLGLENFVFVDDNPAERDLVRQMLPTVAVPELGTDPAYFPAILSMSGYFESPSLNSDDLTRPRAYAAEQSRNKLRGQISNYSEFLASLEMAMTVRPFDEIGRSRIVQLINKSNQFNLTTKRYSSEEVLRIETDPAIVSWQVRLTDKFGDHGMIAVIVVRTRPDVWVIDTWLMSCRVLERGVENTIMNTLFSSAKEAQISTIEGLFIPTARNTLVSDFFDRMQFQKTGLHKNGSVSYSLPVADFVPFETFIEVDRE